MVVACCALVFAMTGTAWAVTSPPNGSVTHPALAGNSVWHGNLAPHSVATDNLRNGAATHPTARSAPGTYGGGFGS